VCSIEKSRKFVLELLLFLYVMCMLSNTSLSYC